MNKKLKSIYYVNLSWIRNKLIKVKIMLNKNRNNVTVLEFDFIVPDEGWFFDELYDEKTRRR